MRCAKMKTKLDKIQAFLDRNGYQTIDNINYFKSFPVVPTPDVPISGTGQYRICYYIWDEHHIRFYINYSDTSAEWGDFIDEEFLNNPFLVEKHAMNTNHERMKSLYDRYYE